MNVDVITDPDSFFSRKVSDGGLLAPAVIVLLAGVSSVLGTLLVIPKVTSTLPSDVGSFAAVGYLIGSGAGVLAVFVLWFFYTGVFYMISRLFEADGEFRDLFLLVGWGFIPSIANGLIGAGMMYFALQGASGPQDPQQLATYMQSIRTGSVFTISSGLTVVFTIWSGMLWAFAVKHARRIPLRQALATVAIPVCSSIGWTIYNLL